MLEFAVVEIGDGREPDMGMRSHVDALAGDEFRRPHLVEEDERADHSPARGGQGAADLEAADVARPRHDDRLDGLSADGVRASGFERGVPAHGQPSRLNEHLRRCGLALHPCGDGQALRAHEFGVEQF